MSTIFLWSDAVATIFSLFLLVRLLFEGGIYMYFLGKPADSTDGRMRYMWAIQLGLIDSASNDDWIRYIWAIQLGLIDAGSSYTSVLLSAVETSLRTWTPLEIAQWALVEVIYTCIRALHKLATATVQGQCLFRLELPIVWLLFEGGI